MDNFRIQVFRHSLVGLDQDQQDQHLTHWHWQASGGHPVLACTLITTSSFSTVSDLAIPPPPLPVS